MTACHVCTARADNANLCRGCTRVLEQAIAELPADLRDLQLVDTRQAHGPLGVNSWRHWDGPYADGALGDAPWAFAPGADDQLWAATNTIVTWARHIAETHGIPLPSATRGTWLTRRRLGIAHNRAYWWTERVWVPATEQPLTIVSSWLLANIDAICRDGAAAQIHDELTGLHTENETWILGRTGDEVFAGRCDATQVTFELVDGVLRPAAAVCGTAMYAREGEVDVRCRTCGTKYPLAARLAEMQRRQIDDQLARAHVIADALTTLERPLGRDRLRKWIQRDVLRTAAPEGPACVDCKHSTCRSIRRPPIHAKGKDDEGHWLYRVGDVRRRLSLLRSDRKTSGETAA